MNTKQTIVIFAIVVVIICICVCIGCVCKESFGMAKKSFKKVDISSITGVEPDECMGHFPSMSHLSPESIERCESVKFNYNGNNDSYAKSVKRHNKGEICLTACMIHWTERRESLYKMLQFVSDTFKELDIDWALYYGSMMGYHRNKELVPWDPDLDIVINYDQIKESIKFETDEYSVSINANVPETSMLMGRFIDKKNYLYCDIFYYKKLANRTVKMSVPTGSKNKLQLVKTDNLLPFRPAVFHGVDVYFPNKIEESLVAKYGDLSPTYRLIDDKYVRYNDYDQVK